MDQRIVIAGGGDVGLHTAEQLENRGHHVVIVEQDSERVEELGDAYVANVIHGDATRPGVLKQVQPERCDAIGALTGDLGTNLAVCMMAKQMTGARTLLRADGTEPEEYAEFVDAVVSPAEIGAHAAANHLEGDDVQTVSEVTGHLEIMEVGVTEAGPAAGRRLADVSFPHGSIFLSQVGGEEMAGPETVLEAGARYIVAVEPHVSDEVLRLLRG
ncbi:MAG: TrkA family potassium uptake protein [Halobacteriaceae archaeon]